MASVNNLMTVKEAAELFRCSVKSIYRWIAEGHIPADAVVRLGPRTLRLDRSEIEAVIARDKALARWANRAA